MKSPQQTNRGSSLSNPSTLHSPSTNSGHDRILSEEPVQNGLEVVSPESNSSSFICLIPGCTYSGVDVLTLESHYGSVHVHELSYSPVTHSQSPVSQSWASPVVTPTTQVRGGIHTIQSPASGHQELAPGPVHRQPTEQCSQKQQQTLQVRGIGRIDPDINCRIVGSCDILGNAVNSLQVRDRPGRTDVGTDLHHQVLGLFSLPTIWFVGLFWSIFVKLFAWVLAKRSSTRYNWNHAPVSRGLFRNMIGGILT